VVAFYEVGNLTDMISGAPVGSHAPTAVGSAAYDFNVVAHAAVGCGAAVASGGKCARAVRVKAGHAKTRHVVHDPG
jgi:hypothetical protein